MPSSGGGGGMAIQIVSTHNVIFPACPAAEEEGEHRTHLVGGITTGWMHSQGNWRDMMCCGGPSVQCLSLCAGTESPSCHSVPATEPPEAYTPLI
mmetsp:Transcript_17631/g.35424  ORF Transcript_17631/g.35424 Transcript_17631/m.35424 type:complete len:95 (+) Transcript_17631:721-1005(+)